MDRQRVVDLLRRHICAGFSEEEAAQFLSHCPPVGVPFAPGQVVRNEGDVLTDILLVARGTLFVRAEDSRGRSLIIQIFGEGDLALPEVSLSAKRTVPDRLTGESDGELLAFRTGQIRALRDPLGRKVYMNLEAWISNEMIRQRNRVSILMQRTTRERVLRYFDILRERQGDTVTVQMTLNDLADYLSVSRASITDIMPRLRAEGLIDYAASPRAKRGEKRLTFRLKYKNDEWGG